MNILINYPKRGEGGPAFSLELAKGLQENGNNVYAVLVDTVVNASQWKTFLPKENVIFIKAHKPGSAVSFVVSTLRFLIVDSLKLKRFFRNHKIDVSIRTLYSHWGPFVDKAVSPKKIVAVCHDPRAHSGAKRRELLYYYFYHNVDAIYVLTRSFIGDTAMKYKVEKERVHYVPHGRMNMYKINDDLKKLQTEYTKKFHFLFFGRIEDYKGLQVLASAYKIVSEKTDECELTILGNGDFEPYRKVYDNLPNVHIINRFIRDDEVGNFFALKNTIAVIPYVDATQSGVIPIAFEFGTPVIASNVGGLKEQLNDGSLGVLYENNDPIQLAECMSKLMDDPDLFHRQSKCMFEYRNKLEWSTIADLFMNQL